MPKIMTADQAFNVSMNTYPLLYASNNIEASKFKFYDHIFNVIGNGYRDLEEFIEGHTINKKCKDIINSFPEKYIGGKDLYYGYQEIKTMGKGKLQWEVPEMNSKIKGLFTKEEKLSHPEVVYWTKVKNSNDKTPYPNFQKEYSMVWKMDMEQLDVSWTEAALEYYKKAKEFFDSDKNHLYSYAWPKDEDKQKRQIEDLESAFSRYKKEGQTEQDFFNTILKEYGQEYNGDTQDFIKKRWDRELIRINDFIEETIDKLSVSLTLRQSAVPISIKLKVR